MNLKKSLPYGSYAYILFFLIFIFKNWVEITTFPTQLNSIGFNNFWSIFLLALYVIFLTGLLGAFFNTVRKVFLYHKTGVNTKGSDIQSNRDKKTIFAWFFICGNGVITIFLGPSVLAIPIVPFVLASLITNSGQATILNQSFIIIVGYVIIAGGSLLFYRSLKRIQRVSI